MEHHRTLLLIPVGAERDATQELVNSVLILLKHLYKFETIIIILEIHTPTEHLFLAAGLHIKDLLIKFSSHNLSIE